VHARIWVDIRSMFCSCPTTIRSSRPVVFILLLLVVASLFSSRGFLLFF
jgi:hypothetical protein